MSEDDDHALTRLGRRLGPVAEDPVPRPLGHLRERVPRSLDGAGQRERGGKERKRREHARAQGLSGRRRIRIQRKILGKRD